MLLKFANVSESGLKIYILKNSNLCKNVGPVK